MPQLKFTLNDCILLLSSQKDNMEPAPSLWKKVIGWGLSLFIHLSTYLLTKY